MQALPQCNISCGAIANAEMALTAATGLNLVPIALFPLIISWLPAAKSRARRRMVKLFPFF
ncbi:MAG TPA: hypothetical protein DDY32_18795 [Desulfobulbaceae bacterium]|nr:hypothetical protein [Desulfobulbaceae bacterium]